MPTRYLGYRRLSDSSSCIRSRDRMHRLVYADGGEMQLGLLLPFAIDLVEL